VKLALRIDVATRRALADGVPALAETLSRHAARATFFFAVGHDAAWGADRMRAVRDAGFECGVFGADAKRWQRHAASANAAWTEAALQRAVDRYAAVFGEAPLAHAAPGWQGNRHALRLTQRLGFHYASDCRGRFPFLPVQDAELVRCPQVPTTLPTLDELLAEPGCDRSNLAARLLERTADAAIATPVFAARAEVEDAGLRAIFDQLVAGWIAQGYALCPLREVIEADDPMALPRCEIAMGRFPGRPVPLLQQGAVFLDDVDLPAAA
jgi:peptidoglycan/xylan/chitin deacetylase (PgdA/CDA1 family)